MSLEARCRNCGNTGYDMFHRPCRCKAGRALVQMAEAYAVMADETVTSSEPRAIIRHFAAAMERKLAANDGVKGGWRDTGVCAHCWAAVARQWGIGREWRR